MTFLRDAQKIADIVDCGFVKPSAQYISFESF